MILTSNVSNGFSAFINIFALLLIFVIVLIMAYFASKLIGKFQGNYLATKSNIRLVESFRVGNNKYIVIIKIADQYYSLGVGKDEINLIDKVSGDSLVKNQESPGLNFKEILSKINKKNDELPKI